MLPLATLQTATTGSTVAFLHSPQSQGTNGHSLNSQHRPIPIGLAFDYKFLTILPSHMGVDLESSSLFSRALHHDEAAKQWMRELMVLRAQGDLLIIVVLSSFRPSSNLEVRSASNFNHDPWRTAGSASCTDRRCRNEPRIH